MKFFDRPMSEIAAEIRDGKVKSCDVTARSLALIAERDGELNSFVTVCKDAAMKRAQELDALPPSEKKVMPLCGVPVAVKDNINTRGLKTTCASKMLENFVPPYDASVVEALESAGAVIVGKTNLDEFAMGSATENSYFGPTRNPHDAKKIPGGSSGGSAAAVGAGLVPAALASDTGGSIRQPGSHCGAVGLKPTYGRVSRFGLVAFASSLDQIGVMTSDVRDAGLMLSVMSAPDRRDSTCAGIPFEDSPDNYSGDLMGLRVGMPSEYFGEGLSQEVRASVVEAIENMKRKGARVVDITLPNVKHAISTYYIICCAEASSNLARFDGVKYGFRADGAKTLFDMYATTRAQGFGAEVKRRIMLGTYVLSSGYYDAYYLKAARVRTLITQDFANAFEKCDVIVSPVAPTPAYDIGEKNSDPLQIYLMDIYTAPANLAGIPAISVPCKTEGLPVGVQFMAPKWREDLLLKAGFAVQMDGGK